MKKRFTAVLAAVLLLAGCGGAAAGGTVSLDGSTAMSSAANVLREAFREARPDVRVNISGSGSGAGVEAVLAGTCDIGLVSRELTDEERARGAAGRLIAWDEIAVIVHPENPVRELSRETLTRIFTGKLSCWREAGGEDRPIAVYGREAGSGTRDAFEEGLGVVDHCAYTNEYCSAGDVVGNVAGNPNAIGYTSRAAVNELVSAVLTDCPLRRPFLMVTREGAALSGEAEAFLEFASGAEAEPYLLLAGAVPPGREDEP